MQIPKHITDLTRKDFQDIARATNPKSGVGVKVEPTDDGFTFSIDETQFKRMVWAFVQNGGLQATADQLEGIPLDPQ